MIRTIADLELLRESVDVEAKAAQGRDGQGEVPGAFWESYSALANTEGGYIVLGVREQGDGSLEVLGLANPEKVRTELWNGLNNPQKVSANLLSEADVYPLEEGGKTVLVVRVPRADRRQRPVYVGANPLGGTYRRNYTGDYRCNEAEVRRMIADAQEEAADAAILEGFSLDDLDPDSLAAYRNEFRTVRPDHPWAAQSTPDFLRSLEAYKRDRHGGKEGLTVAGLLMFGRDSAIRERFPHYFPDYREKTSPGPDPRWDDRLVPDGTWSGNLYDFYRRAYRKLVADLKVPFRFEGGRRVDETPVHEALREALVNTLVHADYRASGSILVEKLTDRFVFRNPGTLRVPLAQVYEGGHSDPRNPTLLRMFRLIGAGEQAGSGVPKILSAWREQHWRTPKLVEAFRPDTVTLELSTLSLLPEGAIEGLQEMFGARFAALEANERLALATAYVERQVNNARLQQITDLHPTDITRLLSKLVREGFLVPVGERKGRYYQLAEPAKGNRGSNSPHFPGSFPHFTGSYPHSEDDLSSSDPLLWGLLLNLARPVRQKGRAPKEEVRRVILELCSVTELSRQQLAELLGRSAKTLENSYLSQMVSKGLLMMRYPHNPNHPNQAYRTREGA
ncbi:putative DNA-binding domain protein [Calidithermus terrae]|uniref:Putative DNA-binding domain protein n=1 Tax=Calidithermus terrae TaxID=1408545 RepID=A0A399EX56_9DEIN|nr:RNA-binding domain-containing protein [Calidithermus terrae]RIH88283.1 putative DNA-binding domain protein [Calidithermus terrae]